MLNEQILTDILTDIVQGQYYDEIVELLDSNSISNDGNIRDKAKLFFETATIDGNLVHPDLSNVGGVYLLSPIYDIDFDRLSFDNSLLVVANACISYTYTGVEDASIDPDGFQLDQFYALLEIPVQDSIPSPGITDLDVARDILFSSNAVYENNESIKIYSKYFLLRLQTWKNSLELGLDPAEEDEKIFIETSQETDLDSELNQDIITPQVPDVLNSFIEMTLPSSSSAGINSLANEAFRLANKDFQDRNAAAYEDFGRVFQRVNQDLVNIISDESTAASVMTKLQQTGLLALAAYASEISDFAAKRLKSKTQVSRNANEFIDPTVDLPWMTRLAEVKRNLESDPIFFSQVIYYFPGLSDFFLTSLSVIVDYSNYGLGGAYEEENAELFLETLKQAFGNGTAEFQLASELNNTQKRIESAINSSPYRTNTSPQTPDIFHLRLGAANFHVPPVSIDVNTRFKTGSMVGGALRQKNSPKFNSGYRETVVSLRLFFPNYQEIWGLSLNPDESIDLSENFEINFNTSSDKVVDKFLSSLRGLVAAFKYSPILPVKNHYLNSVHGITSVALSSMSISTVPNYPFALAVDLQLLNFNHKPFLPMIKDFNQAMHWGKYRQYMGKAATSLHDYVNESFLLKTSDQKEENTDAEDPSENQYVKELQRLYPDNGYAAADFAQIADFVAAVEDQYGEESVPQYETNTLTTNVVDEWINGNHLTLYTPAETQTKLFLPDTSSEFRSDQEEYFSDLGEATWEQMLKVFGIDINNSAVFSEYGTTLSQAINLSRENSYKKSTYDLIVDSIDLLLAGQNAGTSSEQYYAFFMEDFIIENTNNLDDARQEWLREYSETESGLGLSQYTDVGTYRYQGQILKKDDENLNISEVKRFFWSLSRNSLASFDYLVDKVKQDHLNRTGQNLDDEVAKEEVRKAFSVNLYERFFKSSTIQSLMEAAKLASGNFTFNEWEVPMVRVDLDPDSVVVEGFYVTLGNNFAKLQVQMQDEPSYQHIGGKDSFIDVKMTVYGEKELMKLKRIFDHISALARLEHATGVIGFLGIKNIVTALAGIKYVMPLNYTVSTKPSFPHVYDVSLRLVDFDIFQQKREELSSKQQQDFVKQFTNKKNPFLRIKQMWGAFNSYPDLPLQVKNSEGETVGHLDPDYYFRSFEMFDDDVIFNFTNETPRVQSFIFENEEEMIQYEYAPGYSVNSYPSDIVATEFKSIVQNYNGENTDQMVQQMAEFVIDGNYSKSTIQRALKKFLSWTSGGEADPEGNRNYIGVDGFDFDKGWDLLTAFVNFRIDEDNELNPLFEEINPGAFYSVGNIGPSDYSMRQKIEEALQGSLSLPDEEYVSFHPEEVDFHKIISLIPAMSPQEVASGRTPAILMTAVGNHFGYLDNENGRFYLTIAGNNVQIDSDGNRNLQSNLAVDVGTPDTGISENDPPFSGIGQSLSKYQKAYDGDEYKHWEKMLVDTRYRDISGRMLRAFPTYMLWLIDEGGHFAGVKLFDNFYGLQSIIDFSVVSSEDLLGDTLIFRVSNMYSKLTTKESSDIFNPNIDQSNDDSLNLSQGLAAIVDRTLNMSRNILGHMSNEYIVDINNIRLKPGVRVHLRGGYGSNPNSLQTLFNGMITNVEQGEIVTVTAQSDAIELGAMVNSTNKKGDSGKIDGGIDTGLWLSEPRDLMVRLLSMGSSRAREAIALAYGGTIFSENKFGIRHFGTTLYDSMTEQEAWSHNGKMDKIGAAFEQAGSGQVAGSAMSFTGYTASLVGKLFAATANDIDLEIFKRNIYPGNGTGMAQFLGGDLDDGWSTVSAIVDEDFNSRASSDLADLTDIAWNRLLSESQTGGASANMSLERLTEDSELNASGRGAAVSTVLGGAATFGLTALGAAVGGPIGVGLAGTALAGNLTGVMTGRGGNSIWKTMGIVSPNADDDLPGFDEVSFRAQTYMRTVWDMFQICARLLPNYIVAVRPFEDRSTIFYGKPHWLYTSGVVPVTTGYIANEAPKPIKSDSALLNMLNDLNSSTSALMDYAAFYQNDELNDNILSVTEKIQQALEEATDEYGQPINEYAPTSSLLDKVINFSDPRGLEYLDENGDIICKIPQRSGNVTVGMHLPIGNVNSSYDPTTSSLSTGPYSGIHKQINNLPPRYRYPFFIDTKDNDSTGGAGLYHIFEGDTYKDFEDKFKELRELEKNHLESTNQSLLSSENEVLSLDDMDLDLGSLIAQGESIAEAFHNSTAIPTMPTPSVAWIRETTGSSDDVTVNMIRQIFTSWGTPNGPADEQFHIAMRWPLNYEEIHSGLYDQLDASNKQVISDFFQDRMETPDREVVSSGDAQLDHLTNGNAPTDTIIIPDVTGSYEDYKLRKVLVYNPTTKRAVVCTPAYSLWSKEPSGPNDKGPAAVVSPDAAYHLGILSPPRNAQGSYDDDGRGFKEKPEAQGCVFTFVPDSVPVGVVSGAVAQAKVLSTSDDLSASYGSIIGFGNFTADSVADYAKRMTYDPLRSGMSESNIETRNAYLDWYSLDSSVDGSISIMDMLQYGGNPLYLSINYETDAENSDMQTGTYFDALVNQSYNSLTAEELYSTLNGNMAPGGQRYRSFSVQPTASFAPVFSVLDEVSINARNYYDEDFNQEVSVIAGDGRTLLEAQEIWDQFRTSYHTYESVKSVFADVYGMDPDSEIEFPDSIQQIIDGQSAVILEKFGNSARDEFAVLLGEDWANNSEFNIAVTGSEYDPLTSGLNTETINGAQQAIEFMMSSFIDAPTSQGGLVEGLNNFLVKRLKRVNDLIFNNEIAREVYGVQISFSGNSDDRLQYVRSNIRTPKQLFLLMVGLFRQRMWSDAYSRAWLVLRPDRKVWGSSQNDKWSFKPVDRIFRAYIDPYGDYAKKDDKFTQLLVATKAEGNSSSDIFSYAANGIGDFFSKSIGPMWSALTTGLSGLLNMYKLAMQQMGYALNQASDFRKHAHIMNKALNDSIYYSLGREGSILRAVDNPFTREYGEPVIEIREPFQRIHYISSFSHILSNQIQENLNNVATTVTAVSDGKYPVTVALDKGAPAERQVEKTVETGIYFDNMIGEGFFGFLHPLMHPMETIRGVTKNATGTPDELSARRIALSHLKESIKDIYQGELIVIGNGDIRPHDLVYLADVYERMYGIFEVEQVVHHFTSDMGYVTSITPNALVTVNDPAKWYLTSWMHSWLSTQAIRNDTRIYLDSIRAGNTGIIMGNNVSVDRLAEVLGPQMTGGIQFTHGSSALVKDAMAMETAKALPNVSEGLSGSAIATGSTSVFSLIAGGIGAVAGSAAIGAAGVATGGLAIAGTAAAGLVAANLGGQLAWSGWKWVRDNLLDQHGCYVQYLNRNGQPMDSGLSYNQGMAVGQYHSKALLPGILGVRTKTRTPEGYPYIRTDDLFKSLGWRETEIKSLSRYISLENALVHARVLNDAGVGPEKAGLEPLFKVLVKVTEFIDGDTIQVQDILNPTNSFRVRFGGINTGEVNIIGGKIGVAEPGQASNIEGISAELVDVVSPGGKAKQYVYDALVGKVFLLRVNKSMSQDQDMPTVTGGMDLEDFYDAGSSINQQSSYVKDSYQRVLGTIFYYIPESISSQAKSNVESIFRSVIDEGLIANLEEEVISRFKDQMGDVYSADSGPVFYNKFDDIYLGVKSSTPPNYFDYANAADPIVANTDDESRNIFNILVYIQSLQGIYNIASKWPIVAWNEYYEDGYPVTLNWELVVNNLARVFVRDLQVQSESVNTASETAVQLNGDY